MRVSANYFTTLGVRPAVGRFFLPEEDGNPTAPRVLVLGYGFWQRQFEGRPVGDRSYAHDRRRPYTVVGVAPQGFTGVTSEVVDAWVPLTANVTRGGVRRDGCAVVRLLASDHRARLTAGVTPERASAIATAALRAGDRSRRRVAS